MHSAPASTSARPSPSGAGLGRLKPRRKSPPRRATMRGIRRAHGAAQHQAKLLLREDLFVVLGAAGDRPKDLRNRAFLLIGFAGGLAPDRARFRRDAFALRPGRGSLPGERRWGSSLDAGTAYSPSAIQADVCAENERPVASGSRSAVGRGRAGT